MASGVLPDGSEWDVHVTGQPPNIQAFERIDGQEGRGVTWNAFSWPSVTDHGDLPWNVSEVGGGLTVWGVVPAATTNVSVVLGSGQTMTFCPVAVPGVGAVAWVGGVVPDVGTVEEIRALDGQGRTLARGDAAAAAEPAGSSFGFSLTIDPNLVQLPMVGSGSASTDAQTSTPTMTEVITGTLPSGHGR